MYYAHEIPEKIIVLMGFLNRAKKEIFTACVAVQLRYAEASTWAEYLNVPSNVASNRNRTLVSFQTIPVAHKNTQILIIAIFASSNLRYWERLIAAQFCFFLPPKCICFNAMSDICIEAAGFFQSGNTQRRYASTSLS